MQVAATLIKPEQITTHFWETESLIGCKGIPGSTAGLDRAVETRRIEGSLLVRACIISDLHLGVRKLSGCRFPRAISFEIVAAATGLTMRYCLLAQARSLLEPENARSVLDP
jgi:hypothetical protein